MEQVRLPLALLACPIGMVLMIFFMGRGMLGKKRGDAKAGSGEDLASLKAEAARLDERIADLESRGSAERVER
jgi:hypothetical protein